jgi:PAS domain S-box-containing protein
VREGRECRVVLRNYRRDGSLFWNELHLSPVRDDAGRVTHFVGIQTDITELKLIEEAVRASEARFRQLAENIHEVFFIVAAGSREMLYVSPAYEDIWGRTCDSLYRDPQSFFDTIHPDDRERVARAMNLQTEEPGFSECRIVRPDGTLGWVWVRTFPVRSAGGAVYRIVGVAEDVTERKQAEEELHKALEQERELNELKSRFVSMMSHEFRTPLSAILSSSEMLEHYHHKLTEVRQAEHFNRIRLSVKNMTQMLEDILILGKAEAGKMEFHPEPLDLAAFCRDLAEEMQLSAGNQHTIEFVADGDGAEARLDPRLLRQILANLLSNAMKYSPNGDAVHFEMRREDGHIVFSVRDQGIGIPPEEHARMFETFHRAKNVGNIPGTGLGLAIVKRSVDLCGGTIAFDSSVGSGTTFTIALPLDDLHPHEVYA